MTKFFQIKSNVLYKTIRGLTFKIFSKDENSVTVSPTNLNNSCKLKYNRTFSKDEYEKLQSHYIADPQFKLSNVRRKNFNTSYIRAILHGWEYNA